MKLETLALTSRKANLNPANLGFEFGRDIYQKEGKKWMKTIIVTFRLLPSLCHSRRDIDKSRFAVNRKHHSSFIPKT